MLLIAALLVDAAISRFLDRNFDKGSLSLCPNKRCIVRSIGAYHTQ